jgi:hypothetical protein
MMVREFTRRDADGDRISTLEILDVEEAPVSFGLPRSQVSHVHDEPAHRRTARFAQMVEIVKGRANSNASRFPQKHRTDS